MNTMIKAALSITALTALAGLAHADTTSLTSSTPLPQGCTTLCKSAQIPIQLTVPQICDLQLGVSSIILDSTTGKGSGTFKVGANAPYQLLVYTDNQTAGVNTSALKNGVNSIATTVTTLGPDTLTLGVLKAETGTGSLSAYTVNVATTESFGINKPAGVYTDTYRIQVYF